MLSVLRGCLYLCIQHQQAVFTYLQFRSPLQFTVDNLQSKATLFPTIKKMLKDTYAKTLLKVFGENYIARCRSQYKHTPQTLSFTFCTCIFNNHFIFSRIKRYDLID